MNKLTRAIGLALGTLGVAASAMPPPISSRQTQAFDTQTRRARSKAAGGTITARLPQIGVAVVKRPTAPSAPAPRNPGRPLDAAGHHYAVRRARRRQRYRPKISPIRRCLATTTPTRPAIGQCRCRRGRCLDGSAGAMQCRRCSTRASRQHPDNPQPAAIVLVRGEQRCLPDSHQQRSDHGTQSHPPASPRPTTPSVRSALAPKPEILAVRCSRVDGQRQLRRHIRAS